MTNAAEALSLKASLTYTSPEDPFFKKLIIAGLEYLTGRRTLEKRYTRLKQMEPQGTQAWETILELLNVEMDYDEVQFQKIPKEGPVVFVANHPFGVLDGLVLSCLISRVRSDFKVMVNEVLTREPLLAPYLLPIDFRPTKAAQDMNIQTRRDTLVALKSGKALGIFPAGGVATAHKGSRKVEDLEWKLFVAKAVHMSGATVVPLFFHGQNSRLFQLASRINTNLRLGLLLNEVRNKIGDTVKLEIGDPIRPEEWQVCPDRKALLEFMRERTFSLATV